MMTVANYYPELPEVLYEKVSVPEQDVIDFICELQFSAEVKRTTFAVAYNETAGFTALVNTNAAGVQGDNGRWGRTWDGFITATTVKKENMTGNARRFLVFDKWQTSIKMLATKMDSRGIYMGGDATVFANINSIKTGADLYTAYYRGWVLGNVNAVPRPPDIAGFGLLYNKAKEIFS